MKRLFVLFVGMMLTNACQDKAWFEDHNNNELKEWRVIATVRVQTGDTFWGLIRSFQDQGATLSHTRVCNPDLRPGKEFIQPGDQIRICGPADPTALPKTARSP